MNDYIPGYTHHPDEFITVDEDELSLGLDDNRNTLLWLPCSITDDNGELEFEFFTSDIRSSFVVTGLAIDPQDSKVGQFMSVIRVY